MKLLDLSEEYQNALITALLRFTYPLYCTTSVEGFDYHFIGSCFPLRAGDRLFFIFTKHQFDLADGEKIIVLFPEGATNNKAIGLDNNSVIRFPSLDLAAFEVDVNDLEEELHTLDISLISEPDEKIDFEYAVLGCQTALNYINYDTKIIQVRKSGLITNKAKLNVESPEYDFSGVYMITQGTDYGGIDLHRKSINLQTQGLSGSPILAFSINDTEKTRGNVELHLTGIATHVAENSKILHSTHPMAIVQALDHVYKIFPERNDKD